VRKIATLTQARQAGLTRTAVAPDSWVLIPAMLLLAIGMVMVGSASISIAEVKTSAFITTCCGTTFS
jgi:cell division protein FtsW (lipid II flippase)